MSTEKKAETAKSRDNTGVLAPGVKIAPPAGKSAPSRQNRASGASEAPSTNPLHPNLGLLCKLGSIAIEAENLVRCRPIAQPRGRTVYVSEVLESLSVLLADYEVRDWLDHVGPLLPVKRS